MAELEVWYRALVAGPPDAVIAFTPAAGGQSATIAEPDWFERGCSMLGACDECSNAPRVTTVSSRNKWLHEITIDFRVTGSPVCWGRE